MAFLIGTAGHVDHGKTTLIAALTGIDADRLPEEKARGMTIDLGFAYVDLGGIGRVSIVDVPGHERFVKNMLAGAAGVDVALLCVAADEGVMPQTAEHFLILRLLEAGAMVVALTKTDMVDEGLVDAAMGEVRDLLKDTPYEGAPVVPVSAHTGAGLDELKDALCEAIGSLGDRPVEGGWFLPIDRVFTKEGHGTVVTGTLARGKIERGEQAELLPGKERVRIRGIQAHGEVAQTAEAGMRTALNVTGAKREDLHRGQALARSGVMAETSCLNVRLAQVEPIKHASRIRLHLGAGEFLGRAYLLDHAPGYAQIRLESACACARGQRGILRNYSPPTVLAGCEVVTPEATVRRKNDPSAADLLTSDEPMADLAAAVLKQLTDAEQGRDTEAICEAMGVTRQALGDVFESLKESRMVFGFGGRWVHRERMAGIEDRVLAGLVKEHASAPQASGVPRHTAHRASGLSFSAKEFDRLLGHLAAAGAVVVKGNLVSHPSHSILLNPKQEALLERVAGVLLSVSPNVPHLRDVAEQLRVPVNAVEEIVRLGVETGRLVRIDEQLVYASESIDQLRSVIARIGKPFTVAEFRDATQTTRKYALPLLQYFDEIRFTKRVGDQRLVLGSEENR